MKNVRLSIIGILSAVLLIIFGSCSNEDNNILLSNENTSVSDILLQERSPVVPRVKCYP